MASDLEAITRLTPLVIRILGFNPGFMTLQGTNTYLVGNGKRRILVDTGEPSKPKYIEALKSVLNEGSINLAHIIITHWHLDHLGGLKNVYNNFAKDATVWKFPRIDAKNPNTFDSIPLKYLKNEQEIEADGATLRVVHTPGHTTDHIVLHLKEENAVFTGDCILGIGTAVFEDLSDYMKSLEIILKLDAKVLYPGHGPIIEDVKSRIEVYIRHRKSREEQIMQVLLKNKGQNVKPTFIVKTLYADLSEKVHNAAEKNVTNHLIKLEKDGVVKQVSSDEWALSETSQLHF